MFNILHLKGYKCHLKLYVKGYKYPYIDEIIRKHI